MLRTPRLTPRLTAALAAALLVPVSLEAPAAQAAPAAPARAAAQTFYVSPTGSDANPGTAAQPWRTIGRAVGRGSTIPPGSVVDVRGGTYKEIVQVQVDGTAARPITVRAHAGEEVVISGAGVDMPGDRGLIDIRSRSHLVIDGFTLADYVGVDRGDDVPSGVMVRGSATGITLRNLEIRGIRAAGYGGGRVGDAHGIAVYGTAGTPASRIRIANNDLHDLRLGTSEAIVVNGNVASWAITGNTVRDVDNIAIDAIGFEGTGPKGKDQARNGVIAGNVVDGVDTSANPGYDGCSCAAGIYVDGGRDIVIQRNRVARAELGIEVGAENKRSLSSGILVRNNLVEDSGRSGLTLGGYEEDRGSVRDVEVLNNTFVEPDDLRPGAGLVYLDHNLSRVRLVNNVFAIAGSGRLVTGWAEDTKRLRLAGNRWFVAQRKARTSPWVLRGRDIARYRGWQRVTGEKKGSYGAPRLGPDGVPLPGSRLVDRGAGADAGPKDLAGNPRKVGRIDIGAVEVQRAG